MKRKLFLDMDGVIVDFVAGACRLFGRHPVEVTTWDFYRPWGLTDEQFWGPMGRSFWAGLPPTPEAFGVVSACEAAFGAENVCLLSSPCETPGCCDGKLDWVKTYLPQYRRRFLLGPAKQFCAGGGCYLVDDSEPNCEAFRAAGGEACLFPRPWNSMRGWGGLHVLGEWLEAWSCGLGGAVAAA